MENINRYIILYFNVLVCLGGAFIVLFAFVLKRMNKITSISGCFVWMSGACIALFMLINIFQLPYYTNVVSEGYLTERRRSANRNNGPEFYDRTLSNRRCDMRDPTIRYRIRLNAYLHILLLS